MVEETEAHSVVLLKIAQSRGGEVLSQLPLPELCF